MNNGKINITECIDEIDTHLGFMKDIAGMTQSLSEAGHLANVSLHNVMDDVETRIDRVKTLSNTLFEECKTSKHTVKKGEHT